MKLKTYRQVQQFLNFLRDEAVPGKEFPLGAAQVFLELANDDGLSMADIMKRTGQTQSSASRNTRLLTKQMSPSREGFDLAIWEQDPMDFRKKSLHLNKKGHKVLNKMLAILEG